MDGSTAIEFQRVALLRVLEALFASVGLVPGAGSVARLPRALRLMISRVLIPAESATRRLALYLSVRLTMPESVERVRKRGKPAKNKPAATAERAPVFTLFDRWKYFEELSDPRKRVRRGPGPRIWLFDGLDHLRNPPVPEKVERDPDDAVRLTRRMQALHRALSDMTPQAMRLKRTMAKREKAPPGPGRYGPIRPGAPPGSRRDRTLEVDQLLWVCHWMAWHDRGPPEVAAI
jgi:hypothetical protein